MLGKLKCMSISRVIKRGTAGNMERERATHHMDCADQMVFVARGAFLFDRHEIGDSTAAIVGQKAGNQNIGLGEVHLLRAKTFLLNGSEAKRPTLAGVQQRAKDTR